LLLFLSASAKDVVNLNVPMIHQRWDVPQWYDGSWGCGPTSTMMSIAYYHRLPARRISCPKPTSHHNDFGWYLPNNYSFSRTLFDHMDKDAAGNPAWGAYGWCTKEGAAWAELIVEFLKLHRLDCNATMEDSQWPAVKEALDRQHPVILDTRLTEAGHIILIRGYDDKGNMIANDPYGNAHDRATYGELRNGEGVRYTFDFVKAAGHWFVEVALPR